jgi:hypothetical protein
MQYAPTVRVCPSASAAPKQGPNTSEASGLVAHILPFVLGVCWGSSLDTLAQQQPTALRHSPDIRQYSDSQQTPSLLTPHGVGVAFVRLAVRYTLNAFFLLWSAVVLTGA